jgi:hypothetical protein
MLELEKQLTTVAAQSSDEGLDVVKRKRPKIKRREVVDGKPKRGRPTKAAIAKKKNPGILGRPPGDAARIAEFKARLLATAGDSVIEKIIETPTRNYSMNNYFYKPSYMAFKIFKSLQKLGFKISCSSNLNSTIFSIKHHRLYETSTHHASRWQPSTLDRFLHQRDGHETAQNN